MNINNLIYVGFLTRVAALDRGTGDIVWQWQANKGGRYLTLLLDRNLLIVSSDGYMYGLEAATGKELWFNPMAGFRTGVASLASVNCSVQNVAGAASHQAAQNANSSQ